MSSASSPRLTPSIVLVGARGTGKSSLGVIAQSYFGLEHIEVENIVRELSGGVDARSSRLSALTQFLSTHSTGWAIVWPTEYLAEAGLVLLKQYAESHPVIHVTRSPRAVQRQLGVEDASKLRRPLELRNQLYRACSNYEFHNLDEDEVVNAQRSLGAESSANLAASPASLRLKRLEQAFVRFLSNTTRGPKRGLGRFDGLLLPPARSPFTYLLSLSLCQVNSANFKVQWLSCGADACQLEIDCIPGIAEGSGIHEIDEISRSIGLLVRFFDGPVVYHVKAPSPDSPLPERYFDFLRHGMRMAVDYITVDLRISRDQLSHLTANAGNTRVIGIFHDKKPGHDGWSKKDRWDKYCICRDLRLDGVRLTQDAEAFQDNHAVFGYHIEAARLPGPQPFLIAYNEGLIGRPSRYLNQILTPVTTDELQVYARQPLAQSRSTQI